MCERESLSGVCLDEHLYELEWCVYDLHECVN